MQRIKWNREKERINKLQNVCCLFLILQHLNLLHEQFHTQKLWRAIYKVWGIKKMFLKFAQESLVAREFSSFGVSLLLNYCRLLTLLTPLPHFYFNLSGKTDKDKK